MLHFDNRNKNQVFFLLQDFYGLKQVAYLLFDIFQDEIKKFGFFQLIHNSDLYFNGQNICIAVYIDELHIIRQNFFLINRLKTQLASKFKTTDFGSMIYLLGMKVFSKKDVIIVMQIFYID